MLSKLTGNKGEMLIAAVLVIGTCAFLIGRSIHKGYHKTPVPAEDRNTLDG